jgi:hypothetical protein
MAHFKAIVYFDSEPRNTKDLEEDIEFALTSEEIEIEINDVTVTSAYSGD